MNRTANTTIEPERHAALRRHEHRREYAVAIGEEHDRGPQRRGIVGTVISGSWITSVGVERRNVVSPSCGAKHRERERERG